MATPIDELASGAVQTSSLRSWVPGVVILMLVVSVTACTSDDTYLPALLADPMADYEAPGIELVRSREQAEGRDLVVDKPTHAEVGRTYRIEDQTQAESVLADAVTFAEAQGWRIQEDMTVPTLFGGSKTLPPGEGRLRIALGPAEPIQDPDGPRVMNIHLDFGSIRFEDTTTSLP